MLSVIIFIYLFVSAVTSTMLVNSIKLSIVNNHILDLETPEGLLAALREARERLSTSALIIMIIFSPIFYFLAFVRVFFAHPRTWIPHALEYLVITPFECLILPIVVDPVRIRKRKNEVQIMIGTSARYRELDSETAERLLTNANEILQFGR